MLVPVKDLNSASEIYRHVKELKRKMAQSEAAAKLAISKAEAMRLRRMSEAEAERERRRLAELEERKRLEKEAWERAVEKAAKEMEARVQEHIEKMRESGMEPDADAVREAMRPKLTPLKYLRQLCDEAGFSVLAVVGHGRPAKLVEARQEMIWKVRRKFPELSYPQLGALFNRDHTTAMYAVRKVEAKVRGDGWTWRRGASIRDPYKHEIVYGISAQNTAPRVAVGAQISD